MAEEKAALVRINESLRKRLSDLSNKKGTTIIALTNEAVEDFLDKNEYDYKDLMKAIEDSPSLKVQLPLIEKDFKNCPSPMCKNIIETITGRESYLFEESDTEVLERIKKLNKEKIYAIYVHFDVINLDMNKITETVKKISEHMGESVIKNFDVVHRKEISKERGLIFVSYKKEEEIKKEEYG